MTPITPEGEALTELVLLVFRLNGRFLEAAERIAAPAGLTAARWQVLGAILSEPKSVAGIARDMGLARQSVQRLADILAVEGLAEYRANPAHKRAKLLTMTDAGSDAVARLGEDQHRWANATAAALSSDELRACLDGARRLAAHLSREAPTEPEVRVVEGVSATPPGRSE
jgi:DNA-binding MarR family transcriptional regulator